MKLRRLSTAEAGFDAALEDLIRYDAGQDPGLAETVRGILAAVRQRGDAAVLEYSQRFDKVRARSISELEVPGARLKAALDAVPAEQLEALRAAHARIRSFHEKQLQKSWDYTEADGTRLGQRVTPLERVGL